MTAPVKVTRNCNGPNVFRAPVFYWVLPALLCSQAKGILWGKGRGRGRQPGGKSGGRGKGSTEERDEEEKGDP